MMKNNDDYNDRNIKELSDSIRRIFEKDENDKGMHRTMIKHETVNAQGVKKALSGQSKLCVL